MRHLISTTAMLAIVTFVGGCAEQASTPKDGPAANGTSANGAERETTAEDVRKEAGEAAQTAAEYARQKKAEYENELEGRLEDLDDKIARLEEKIAAGGEKAKAEWKSARDALEEKRGAAEKKLDEIRQKSPEAWRDLKQGADEAFDELQQAYRDAAARFGDGKTKADGDAKADDAKADKEPPTGKNAGKAGES